jgi:hypothetical protein
VCAIALVGAFAVSGAVGARDALLAWPERRSTFEGFSGGDTLIGRAAARWEAFGDVRVEQGLGHSGVTIDAVRRYRLDPEPGPAPAKAVRARAFRVAAPEAAADPGERIVERVRDPRGLEVAVVLARSGPGP